MASQIGLRSCHHSILVGACLLLAGLTPQSAAAWTLLHHSQLVSRPRLDIRIFATIQQQKISLQYAATDDHDSSSNNNSNSSYTDSTSPWNEPLKSLDDNDRKLGINLGSMLGELTEREASELRAAATEIINDAIAEGIDEIELLRTRLRKEIDQERVRLQRISDNNAERESANLLNKIDNIANSFLAETQASRAGTKLAAAADRAMEGIGMDLGSWGTLGGAVVTLDGGSSGSLLGSVDAAQQKQQPVSSDASATSSTSSTSKKIVVLADVSSDAYAKMLVPTLIDKLKEAIPNLKVDVYSPSATLPLGGDNAACALLFCTSLNDKSSVSNALDRLLRKTLSANGGIAQPPTQLVVVSTVGTERTNKMPYSMQNMMGGGKLDKRRQMEETVISAVQRRWSEPALDFTICKLGEIKGSVNEAFALAAGDTLDGTTAVDTAATILTEAIAFQPFARNSTISCVGSLASIDPGDLQYVLDDSFLRLDGPEIFRMDVDRNPKATYGQLCEYVREWAALLASTGKGLTTKVFLQDSVPLSSQQLRSRMPTVAQQLGVRLLFVPTATGKNYLSRDEELVREKSGQGTKSSLTTRKMAQEGGLEIVVEITTRSALRIRAKRTNYAQDAVIKEMSEETILNRLRDSLDVWKKGDQKLAT